uniref:Serpentine receptor class gamma n=1 Tax=Rhabditophanes sp. KR3021 TaxID=114890 RepID=A0AC35TPK8_9BILA
MLQMLPLVKFFNTLITPLFFFLADLMAMFIFGCYSKIARKQWEEELYTKSSLGYRFQIQENLRIFWAVQTIFFILCISSILTTFMAIVANMHVAQRLDSILVFNAFVLFAIAVAASVLLFAHKSALTKIFPCFFKKNKIEVILSSEDKIRENKKITDNYFNQYETQW